jgi:hypothetical protein
VQTVNEGGEFARRLWERLVEDTERYLTAAVAGGVARPTEDERARAELIVIYKLGTYTFAHYAIPPLPGAHPADLDIPAVTARFAVPALELFTHGLYRTTEYLDAYRARGPHPDGPSPLSTSPSGTPARRRTSGNRTSGNRTSGNRTSSAPDTGAEESRKS